MKPSLAGGVRGISLLDPHTKLPDLQLIERQQMTSQHISRV